MKDKLPYMCMDEETKEKIYFEHVDAGVLAWIYLHYVTMDNFITLNKYDGILVGYYMVLADEEEYEPFENLLHSIYALGLRV